MKVKEFVAVRQIEDDFRLTGGEALVVKLFPLNYLPYLFEKNAVVVEFI
jgi:hypothetical protein